MQRNRSYFLLYDETGEIEEMPDSTLGEAKAAANKKADETGRLVFIFLSIGHGWPGESGLTKPVEPTVESRH